MIIISLINSYIHITFTDTKMASFNSCIQILKNKKFRYNASTKSWIGGWHVKDEIKSILEDFDEVKDLVSDYNIEQLSCGSPLQFSEPIRRVPDYSLLNYPPIIGKHPYENFQKIAITKCINKSCLACYYGMGSGKSYIASAIIAHRLYKYHDCGKVLFITSNIGVRNLYHELFKFIKDLDKDKVKIANKDYRNPFDDPNTDIVVTSYNSMRLIGDYYKKKAKISSKSPRNPWMPLEKWFDGKNGMIILDESHNVANPSSQQSYIITLHSKLFKYRYLFSGTPADKFEKIYNQYYILDPYLVYNLSFTDWKNKMAVLGDRFSAYSIRYWKKDELEKQNQRFLSSYGEYHSTEDLVELPEYTSKKIYIEMSHKHRQVYEEVIRQDLSQQRNTKDTINRFPYQLLAVDTPSLLVKHSDKFDDNLNNMLSKFKDSYLEKYNALEDIISDHENEKIIVWVIHPSTARSICEKFNKYNPICITGETGQKERFDLVDEFKKGDHKLLVAVIQTLSTSVTITESTVSVYFERNFDYTNFEQSQFRNYRMGQTNSVIRYDLIYDKSLDCLADKNLESKGTLVSGLCSRDFLSQEEWQKIFNCDENTKI